MSNSDFKNLQAKYKVLLQNAYIISKTNQGEGDRLYAQADELRKTMYAF